MTKLNIVYAYMQQPRYEVASHIPDTTCTWTQTEEPDADVIVYMNGYSYEKHRTQNNPRAFRILYLYEPHVVYPRQFMRHFWQPFDAVFTWSRFLIEQGPPFVDFPSLYYDFPFGAAHGLTAEIQVPTNWKSKRVAIAQVVGNKHSLMPSEQYSTRRHIARWFQKNRNLGLDTYGTPPMRIKSHKGKSPNKLETLSQYRFALCLENDAHPIWAQGYITEKIFDCFYAFTVPIYKGAPDVDKLIPKDCYIDLDAFTSLEELDCYLSAMTDHEFETRLHAIADFLKTYDAPSKHSCHQLYAKAIKTSQSTLIQSVTTRQGLMQQSTLWDKLCAIMMSAAIPIRKAIVGSHYSGQH